MKTWGIGWVLLASVFAAAPSVAGNGTIPTGSNGGGVEDAIAGTWNTDWFCSKRPNTLYAWRNIGPCSGREASLSATVLSGGGQTQVSHTYEYDLECVSGLIQQTIRFDSGTLTNISSGTFTFNLSGGDQIRLVTTEGPQPVTVPSMGRLAILAAAAAVALGLLWRLRR